MELGVVIMWPPRMKGTEPAGIDRGPCFAVFVADPGMWNVLLSIDWDIRFVPNLVGSGIPPLDSEVTPPSVDWDARCSTELVGFGVSPPKSEIAPPLVDWDERSCPELIVFGVSPLKRELAPASEAWDDRCSPTEREGEVFPVTGEDETTVVAWDDSVAPVTWDDMSMLVGKSELSELDATMGTEIGMWGWLERSLGLVCWYSNGGPDECSDAPVLASLWITDKDGADETNCTPVILVSPGDFELVVVGCVIVDSAGLVWSSDEVKDSSPWLCWDEIAPTDEIEVDGCVEDRPLLGKTPCDAESGKDDAAVLETALDGVDEGTLLSKELILVGETVVVNRVGKVDDWLGTSEVATLIGIDDDGDAFIWSSLCMSPIASELLDDEVEADVGGLEDVVRAAISGGADDTELLRTPSSEDGEGRGQKASRWPSCDDVKLFHIIRLTSLFRYRGFSSSSFGCGGAAAAKHKTGSNVDRTTRDAARITEDLRNMIA